MSTDWRLFLYELRLAVFFDMSSDWQLFFDMSSDWQLFFYMWRLFFDMSSDWRLF